MSVESSTRNTHGGKRRGAGRKKTGKCHDAPHRTRPSLSSKHAVHVTLRTVRSVLPLRQRRMYEAIRRALVRCLDRGDFRVVNISIQNNHIHLIIEASDRRALTRGMQSYVINTARAINKAWGREGKVFAYRYHASQIRTASYARNALSYVLNNWRRHQEDFRDGNDGTQLLDKFSSAISFRGWAGGKRFKIPDGYEPLPVSPPQTQLLRFDWEWHGLIDPYEVPGPMWK